MIQQIQIHSWSNFKQYIDEHILSNPSKYLFRGQGNYDWQLETSFDRKFKDFDKKIKDPIEKSLLDNFKHECEHLDGMGDLLKDSTYTKALAQHFGLPTRLLDWSESPYIAAFFAFQSHFEHSNFSGTSTNKVSVYILNKDAGIWTDSNGVQIKSAKYLKNDRLRSQAGYFTISTTPFKTLDEFVEYNKEEDALIKIGIPSSEAKGAIRDLQLMGIKHSILFPDLEGISKAALYKTLMTLDK